MTRRLPALGAALVAAALLATACGGDDDPSVATAPQSNARAESPAASTPAARGPVVIDVRTPEEFAAGHLAGAVNLNVEDGTFEAALDGFDPAGAYLLYCRSGRRADIALDLMTARGFTDAQNLGSLEEAAGATGLTVVAP